MYATKLIRPTVYYREVHDRPEDAVRLVGFSEYRLALNHYDQLLRSATRGELRVMDSLVRRNSQYTVAANLLKRMPRAETSHLSIRGGSTRQGLEWVAALARIEYGAIQAAYTKEDTPFPLPAREAPEAVATNELLLEAALMHAWALHRDAVLGGRRSASNAKNQRPQTLLARRQQRQRMLGYERRMKLTWKLLQAVQLQLSAKMTDLQRREFVELTKQTAQLRENFRKHLLGLGFGIRNRR